ncbi:MAG: hypothetical protein EOO18_03645 [Chryseobacterium sp.]|nr:MAG: hypothetical protein EOO18_03645 [Chryseobacterium sp.]
MKRIILFLAVLLCAGTVFSQNIYKAQIKDSKTRLPLSGASVRFIELRTGMSSDSTGMVTITGIPDGKAIVIFQFTGYAQRTDTLTFPMTQTLPAEILLYAEDEELEEVLVSATRSSRTIARIPTRVEVISGEELDEKSNMKPGDIRMLLSESTGIQTQQTSATSANSSIRIQGLDGKYTQIIRDGFPLYAGFSGGLGLLQIAPLDLQQVEVIKGSSSTLYGGGAIAGLVNLVSKKPTEAG